MNYRLFFIVFLLLSMPIISHAQPAPPTVLISEIAWMGTDSNPAHEWIELYSFATTDLTGWTLTSDDNNISITLSGVVTPHSITTLERDSDDPVPGASALQTYTGELMDSCVTLTLKNPAGDIVDQAVGEMNWSGVGGTSTSPIKTPQRTRMGTWVTAAPTPGLDNAQADEAGFPADTVACPTVQETKNSGGGGSSKKKLVFSIDVDAPEKVYLGKPVTFTAIPKGLGRTEARPSEYLWNFGDTGVGEGKETTHTFNYVGEYVVMVEASTSKKHTSTRHDVTVLPHILSLSLTKDGDIKITNVSPDELTLDGYTISGDTSEFVFPKYSILKPDMSATLSRDKIGDTHKIELKDLDDFIMASLQIKEEVTFVAAPTTQPKEVIQPIYAPRANTAAFSFKKKNVEAETPETEVTTEPVSPDDSGQDVVQATTPEETEPTPKRGLFGRILNRIASVFGF